MAAAKRGEVEPEQLQLPGSPREKKMVELSQDTYDTGGLQNRLSQPTMSPPTSTARVSRAPK